MVCSIPVLLSVAMLILIFGQDHPTGKWSNRHNIAASSLTEIQSANEKSVCDPNKIAKVSRDAAIIIHPVKEEVRDPQFLSVDVTTNKSLTLNMMAQIIFSPLTWLPTLAYLTTFGVELTIDSKMADVLFVLYSKSLPGFTQTTAGYYTSIL